MNESFKSLMSKVKPENQIQKNLTLSVFQISNE